MRLTQAIGCKQIQSIIAHTGILVPSDDPAQRFFTICNPADVRTSNCSQCLLLAPSMAVRKDVKLSRRQVAIYTRTSSRKSVDKLSAWAFAWLEWKLLGAVAFTQHTHSAQLPGVQEEANRGQSASGEGGFGRPWPNQGHLRDQKWSNSPQSTNGIQQAAGWILGCGQGIC